MTPATTPSTVLDDDTMPLSPRVDASPGPKSWGLGETSGYVSVAHVLAHEARMRAREREQKLVGGVRPARLGALGVLRRPPHASFPLLAGLLQARHAQRLVKQG
jgi:hypothetical protein